MRVHKENHSPFSQQIFKQFSPQKAEFVHTSSNSSLSFTRIKTFSIWYRRPRVSISFSKTAHQSSSFLSPPIFTCLSFSLGDHILSLSLFVNSLNGTKTHEKQPFANEIILTRLAEIWQNSHVGPIPFDDTFFFYGTLFDKKILFFSRLCWDLKKWSRIKGVWRGLLNILGLNKFRGFDYISAIIRFHVHVIIEKAVSGERDGSKWKLNIK